MNNFSLANQCLALPEVFAAIIDSQSALSNPIYCSQTKCLVWEKRYDSLNRTELYIPPEIPFYIASSAFLIGLGLCLLELYADKTRFSYGHANFQSQKTPWLKKQIKRNLTKTPDFECCKFMCLILTIIPLAITFICLATNPKRN